MKTKRYKTIWGVTVLSVVFYAATILFRYGYNNYFGIPSEFIEFSIKENIIFFFEISYGIILNFFSFSLIIILLLAIPLFLFIAYLVLMKLLPYQLEDFGHFIISKIFLIIIVISPFVGSYRAGYFWAENRTNHYVVEGECLSTESDYNYIIPTFYQKNAILIPYDFDKDEVLEGFRVVEVSDINCEIKSKDIINPNKEL